MRKEGISGLLVGVAALVMSVMWGCSGKYEVERESRLALGTIVEITVAAGGGEQVRQAVEKAFAEFERIDGMLSTYREQSEISRLNRTGELAMGAEAFDLVRQALQISALSGGAFDITVGPLVDLWGFDEGGAVPREQDLGNALRLVGYEKVTLDPVSRTVRLALPGMKIDLGAIGKGHAVDRAAEILKEAGIENAIIDAGGDIRLLGHRPGKDFWRIGIRHPRDPGRLLVSLDLADRAVVTSGDYERFFIEGNTRYHHLLDPATGLPAGGCQSVTVIADGTTEADAYATAAFVMGAEAGIDFLRSLPGVEGIIVDGGGRTWWTDEERLRR